MTLTLVFYALLLLGCITYKVSGWGRRESHLPPGPPTTPIIGNILQFPKAFLQLQFSEWAREYGDVVSLKVFNTTIVILSSPASVRSVLDKHGIVTGGRPRTLPQLVYKGSNLSMEDNHTTVWRRDRKIISTFFNPESLEKHLPVQHAESLQLVNDLLDDPTSVYTHIMRATCSTMMSLVYGKRTPVYHNSDAEKYFEGIKLLNATVDTAAFPPVEFMPFLKYIPNWLAPWGPHMERMVTVRNKLYRRLLGEAEQLLHNDVQTDSLVEKLLESTEQENGLSRDGIFHLASLLMDGGAETTASFIQNIVLAFLSYPEYVKKAQEEIDRVIGTSRLPILEDYADLPYLKAFVEEVHRFRPLAPLGLPHMATEDVTYNDYIIPKGTMIFQNTWGMFRDPAFYNDPELFQPERFLNSKYGTKDGVDTSVFRDNFAFGAGRRICPGEIFARRSIALDAMYFVWAFDFTSKSEVTLDLDNCIVPAIVLAPKPFSCDVKVRDVAREKIIRATYAAARDRSA